MGGALKTLLVVKGVGATGQTILWARNKIRNKVLHGYTFIYPSAKFPEKSNYITFPYIQLNFITFCYIPLLHITPFSCISRMYNALRFNNHQGTKICPNLDQKFSTK